MSGEAQRWLTDWRPPGTARLVLVCLPHAGAGAFQFRPWQELAGPRIAVVAVQLPGRENRWREEPLTRSEEVVEELAPALAARLDLPYVVFGHSMGALLGYEVARALGLRYGLWPEEFVASACRAPDAQGEPTGADALTDRELVADLAAQGAVPDYVAANEKLVSVVARPLRADLALCDRYVPPATDTVLPCPVHVWRGRDDLGVTDEHARQWAAWSAAPAGVRRFDGGHLYHLDRPHEVVDALRRLGEDARAGVKE
ncbi:thioesterase [Streptomyces actinomycinicus]|uniref:Thioesterase n=1 Tax=Streptomyces actinomycinicus TaxID=1695166 RepID=A0A937EHE6_9ACTN|nr:alpha/beta fold hydrolase [Streptomyces actinomycinicus]MBL1082320.1 thioesterase [Streptomyces actinomycinicus]